MTAAGPHTAGPSRILAFVDAPVALIIVDRAGLIADANPAAADLLGHAVSELVGLPVEHLITPELRRRHARHRARFARSPARRTMGDGMDLEVQRADGQHIAVDIALGPMQDGYVCVAIGDATDQRRRADRLSRLANEDPLTGLHNRRGFDGELARRIPATRRAADRFAVLAIDIDNFKDINDAAGHPAGDLLLQAVASTMRARARDEDVLARVGGDEFLLYLVGATGHRAAAVADELRCAIAGLRTDDGAAGTALRATVSIGVAASPADGDDVRAIVTAADARLYAAKAGGRNRVVTEP